jgi:hypothetical protein
VTCCHGSTRVALQALFGFDFGPVLGLIWAQRVEARALCSTEGDQRPTMPGRSPPIPAGGVGAAGSVLIKEAVLGFHVALS